MNDQNEKTSTVGSKDSRPIVCRISDIDMPFFSMVSFMVKWAIAAIPALLILGFLAIIAAAALAGYRGIL